MTHNIVPEVKVRILKKVRRTFINKTPDEPETPVFRPYLAVSIPAHIDSNSFNIIDPEVGIVEKDRKIYFGNHYVQSSLKITSVSIDKAASSEVVTVHLQQKDPSEIVPWEYGVKRLESYGDLNLMALGWKIKNHHASYSSLISHYIGLISSGDSDILAFLRKSKNQAILLAKDIESKYLYQKSVHFLDKNSSRLLSFSYSKELVEKFGYNIDDYAKWIKENGLPCIYKGNNGMYMDLMNTVLDFSTIEKGIIFERPEFVIQVYDKEGNKREVVGQATVIIEPTVEGLLVSAYSFIKRVEETCKKEGPLEKTEDIQLKKKKVTNQEGNVNETALEKT